MKYMMVPVEDIEKLEQARKDLFKLLGQDTLNMMQNLILHDEVTDVMWKIANTKWQQIEGPR